jgi:hypothetical protein
VSTPPRKGLGAEARSSGLAPDLLLAPSDSGSLQSPRRDTDRPPRHLPGSPHDEPSARKKVEKAFSRGRSLGVDVDAGEAVWTYTVEPSDDKAVH